MANAVLVFPKIQSIKCSRPNLCMLYLAAVLLEQGFSVEIIDETVQEDARTLLKQHISSNTICVGISALTGAQLRGALDVAGRIRVLRPELPIVWGGTHATANPIETLQHDLVDAVCIGEGEITFPEMVSAFRDGTSLANVNGIGYKEDGQPKITRTRGEYYDLNDLPPLPYHLVDLSLYKLPKYPDFFGFSVPKVLSLETSRGCPFRCAYCVQSVRRERFRYMGAEKVVSCIQDIVAQGVRGVVIVDDNFFSNDKRAKQVMRTLGQLNLDLEIFVGVRADYLEKTEDDTFDLIKQSGVKLLSIGVESGSDRILEIISKRETIQQAHNANKRLSEHGIHTFLHFIVGFPGEKLDDIIATYQAMTKILKTNPNAKISNKKLVPLPGTAMIEMCCARGMQRPKTIEEWADIEDMQWDRHAPYVDPEAQAWFWNTRYYNNLMRFLSGLRTPHQPLRRRLFKLFFTPLFYLLSWVVGIRARLRASRYSFDNLVFEPFALMTQTLILISCGIKNPRWVGRFRSRSRVAHHTGEVPPATGQGTRKE